MAELFKKFREVLTEDGGSGGIAIQNHETAMVAEDLDTEGVSGGP
jgi:hypothetical protein